MTDASEIRRIRITIPRGGGQWLAGPWCSAKIDGRKGIPLRRRPERERMLALKGLTPDRCGHPAMYRICGDPLCERHAGVRALEILKAMGKRKPDRLEVK